jgi:HAD superfamily hydrolase (TIGR01490 family)
MAKESRRLAVFDIDGTIFRSSLVVELTEDLIRKRIFPAKSRKIYERFLIKWLDRGGSYEDYINSLVIAFGENVRSVSKREFLKVARDVVGRNENRVYRYTRDLVKKLKRRGYYLLAISGSPKMIVEIFAKKMGFNKVYGRMLEIDSRGRFTGGHMHIDLIADKARILMRAAEKEKLTLKGSFGVGDTESDIAFLKLVDHPIAFNPNMKLYRYAKRAKWKVVVERKDVIYDKI